MEGEFFQYLLYDYQPLNLHPLGASRSTLPMLALVEEEEVEEVSITFALLRIVAYIVKF